MPCYTGLDQLCCIIWCEIFVIREGYILYLKKWSKQQQSVEAKLSHKSPQGEGKIHSDIQRLAPGGFPRKSSDSLQVANSMVKDVHLKPGLASHQSQLTRSRHDKIQMKTREVKKKL